MHISSSRRAATAFIFTGFSRHYRPSSLEGAGVYTLRAPPEANTVA